MSQVIRKKLLYVEDQPNIAAEQTMRLVRHGYRVTVVDTGEDAIAAVRNDADIDLVLMDIDLGPGVDSGAAAQRMLAIRHLPIIFVASYEEGEMLDAVQDLTGYGYVLKSADDFVLFSSIEMAFHLFDAHQRRVSDEREAALKEAHVADERFQDLFRRMNEGGALHEMVYDETGTPINYRLLDVNPQFETIIGLSGDAVRGKLATEVYGNDEPPYLALYARVAATGEPHTFETYYRRLDKHFHISVFSPGPRLFATVFLDVTPCRVANEMLQAQTRRLNIALEGGELAWWEMTLPDGTVSFSPAKATMLGFDPDQFPRYEDFAALVHPDDRAAVTQALNDHVERRSERFEIEFRMRNTQGAYRWFRDVGSVVYETPGSHVTRLVGITQDISEHRRVKREIEALVEQKNRLLKEVHHRVKNNLAMITGLLMLQAGATREEEVAGALLDARNRIAGIEHMYRQLFQSGDYGSVDLNALLPELVDSLAETYESTPVDLIVHTAPAAIILTPERAAVVGIIVNELVTNALKYAFPDHERGTIRVSIRKTEDGRVCVGVEDDGIGIPEGAIHDDAVGFGLRLVRAETEQLAGTLEIERDNGTRVTLTF
ncbi:MAG: PAS domain-containing protein [Spirochaetales bacterium]|nr:PAS domain-containing protein [Spirochaetales bacterium]